MKKGDLFNAITKIRPHKAWGGPCVYVRAEKSGRLIHATSKDLSDNPGADVRRTFPTEDFDIVPICP